MRISSYQVVIIGDSDAGKPEFIRTITEQHRTFEHRERKLGVDLTISEYKVDDREVHLHMFDLSDHPSFSFIRQYYLHGADLCVIVIDAANPNSIGSVTKWKAEVDKHGVKATSTIVVIKADRVYDRTMVEKEIGEMASRQGFDVVFISTETGEGCTDALKAIMQHADRNARISCT
jgi:small GTP-binding protein